LLLAFSLTNAQATFKAGVKTGIAISILEQGKNAYFDSVMKLINNVPIPDIYSPDGKRYLVVHGDGFDSVSTNHKWVAQLGSVGYDALLKVNRLYNRYRAWRGKDYYSVSKAIKARVKSAVNFVGEYEQQLQALARKKECDGIICGHIHTPEDKQVGEIRYLNSGDWVESMTAIVEHFDGRLELIRHVDFMAGLAEEVRQDRPAGRAVELVLSA
jgi:UDP-2,3-diacylglucosamine pyrophosphatase LpxH